MLEKVRPRFAIWFERGRLSEHDSVLYKPDGSINWDDVNRHDPSFKITRIKALQGWTRQEGVVYDNPFADTGMYVEIKSSRDFVAIYHGTDEFGLKGFKRHQLLLPGGEYGSRAHAYLSLIHI